ncbi:hypothetical protein COCON_G00226340 [Conger conger]|uniref:Arginyl-tRNA--protein transferase 1 n=1 Tax=Conger conger TaxID=82655 RepID=A0A9Q1HN35_CONCO|nr:hypothetical protein COCON_G00226340 [Conger conger]
MAAGNSYTIVEYFGGESGYACGYCKSEKGNFSHGMWAHTMTVQDYQDLVDRGWRRSGKYVYKPIMNETCCPQYTIRCHPLNFQPSKTHKKILKRMSKFLSKGEMPTQCDGEPMDSVCEEGRPREAPKASCSDVQEPINAVSSKTEEAPKPAQPDPPPQEPSTAGREPSAPPKPGVGADPSRPPCRKARDVQSLPEDAKHQLEVRLVRSGPPSQQFKASFEASYQVYKLYQISIHGDPPDKPSESQVKLVPVSFEDPGFMATYDQTVALYSRYQMVVHGDAASECGESEFRRFLCDSPLEEETAPDGPVCGYGSFHQQYWLDGRLVAVGVIDILPTCVSSVYLYYHPDFSALSLGTYSALREMAFTRQLQSESPKLSCYYLGFYIHSCPKMRYKGCRWRRPVRVFRGLRCGGKGVAEDVGVSTGRQSSCARRRTSGSPSRCVPLLESSAYARFNQDPDAGDEQAVKDLGRVLVLYRRAAMPYAAYARKRRGSSDEQQVQQYAGLVGQVCAQRILLYRA